MVQNNTLRIHIAGKAKEHFDFWKADHDPTNAAKTYEELLNKAKNNARMRSLDSSTKDEIQQGGTPADLGVFGGRGHENYDYDPDGVLRIWIQKQRQGQRKQK